jgi:hypothetical protein
MIDAPAPRKQAYDRGRVRRRPTEALDQFHLESGREVSAALPLPSGCPRVVHRGKPDGFEIAFGFCIRNVFHLSLFYYPLYRL